MIPIADINPTTRRPVVVYVLIAINLAVFLYQSWLPEAQSEAFVYRWGFIPYFFSQDFHLGSLSTPLSSMFMHASWAHVGMNMWFLHIFGDNVEDVLGRVRFVLFYLGTGLFAAFAQLLVDSDSHVPMVGASGAIAGVLGAYFRLFPAARVQAWVIILIEVPAFVFIFVWFMFQLILGLGSLELEPQRDGGVAFFAHIGGFLAGLWLVSVLLPRGPHAPRLRG